MRNNVVPLSFASGIIQLTDITSLRLYYLSFIRIGVSLLTIEESNFHGELSTMKKRNIVIHILRFIVLLIMIGTFAAVASVRTHKSTDEYKEKS